MINLTEGQLWVGAGTLVKLHGADGERHVAEQYRAALDRGERGCAALWRLIADTLTKLRSSEGALQVRSQLRTTGARSKPGRELRQQKAELWRRTKRTVVRQLRCFQQGKLLELGDASTAFSMPAVDDCTEPAANDAAAR